jgi:dTDP-4-dehydrorhamnose 3,5-epimerase-like enzyme
VIIKGQNHLDKRGLMSFVNDFDMNAVRRFYSIQPVVGKVRAWQGHKEESKWFYAVQGSFRVKLKSIKTQKLIGDYVLDSFKPEILSIPRGAYNGFEAIQEGSILLIFSDFTLQESKMDDHRATVNEIPWD